MRQCVEAVFGTLENLCVGLEGDLRAAFLRSPGDLQRAHWRATLVTLLIDVTVAPDLEVEPLGKCIDDRDANAVQTTRDLVGRVFKFAARMQHGQHDFSRRSTVRHRINRDAAAVVDHGHRVVDVDGHVDLIAEPGQRLVNRVVDDLVDKMMEAWRTCGPDVHRRPLPYGLESLEYLDFVRAVIVDHAVPVGLSLRRRRACQERVGLLGVLLIRMFHACP